MKVLSTVKHKYIVEFLYVEQRHNTLLLFLEYMEGVTITTVICSQYYVNGSAWFKVTLFRSEKFDKCQIHSSDTCFLGVGGGFVETQRSHSRAFGQEVHEANSDCS